MDGAQILAQHPHRRVEPLEGGEGINEEQIPGVPETDMSPFMCENRRIAVFVVATVHHDIVHPAKGLYLPVIGHADCNTIGLGMLLASLNQHEDSEHRHQGVPQRHHYTYYKYKGQQQLPPFGPCISGYLHLDIAHRYHRHCLHRHRLVQRDDTQRQYKRGNSREEQRQTIHSVEGLTGQHQAIEHIEYRDEHSHLGVVDQKVGHTGLRLLFLYLIDKFAQFVNADLLFFDKRGDGREIGVVEVVLDNTSYRPPSVFSL